MKGNSILNKARYSENTDEWYTDYKTVEEELSHYVDQFCNKIVLCNDLAGIVYNDKIELVSL